ncbi:MAG: TIGR00730 family Rossman fold protein [Planctomycetota bacterium]
MQICVYLSASLEAPRPYFETARAVGRRIGTGGHGLVYGGGNIGTMEEVARGAKETGASVVSVIPSFFHEDGLTFEESDELIVTRDMQERRRIMIERSDAAIALPGGFGTLEELAEFLTAHQLGFHEKPLVIVDLDGFWSGYLTQIERMREERMIHDVHKDLIRVVEDGVAAVELLERLDGAEA